MSTALTNARQLWTTNPQRTFSGSTPAEAGGIMEIVMDSTVYTVTIAADGSWSWQPPSPLAEGPHNLSVRTIDRAGNIGDPSLFIVNVDLSAPDQPLIIGVGDDFGDKTGLVGSGQQTDDRTPTLKGVAEPDSIVRLYNAQNQLIGSVKASSNGYWEITPTLADGEHSLYVTATDGRGYVSQASEAFTLTVADDAAIPVPGKVEITHALDDAGAAQGKLLNGALTDDTTPTLRGTAPAGSNVLIQYRDVNGQWVDGGYATLNGTEWSWTPDKALGEGKWEFRAYAGSGWTDEFTLEIDLTPGSELAITHAWDDFGANTGRLESGAITDDRTPTLFGRAEANSIVYIHFRNVLGNWDLLGSVQVGADGRWRYESERLSPATYKFSVSDNIQFNNNAPVINLIIGNADVLRPEILYALDDIGASTGNLASGSITDDTQPELHGRSEANSLVNIHLTNRSNNDNYIYSVTTDNKGNWDFIPPIILEQGVWQVTAESYDDKIKSDTFNLHIVTEKLPSYFKEDFQKSASISGSFKIQGGTIFLEGSYNYQTDRNVKGTKWIHMGDNAKITYDLDYLTSEIKFLYEIGDYSTKTNDVVTIYNQHNEIIYQEKLKPYKFTTFSYKATDDNYIGKIIIDISNDNAGFNIDDIEYKPEIPKSIFDFTEKTQEHIGNDNIFSEKNSPICSLVNINSSGDNKTSIMLIAMNELIQASEENLYINNDHSQVMVTGKEGDLLRLSDILHETETMADWTQQTGTVTIAGVQYDVYSHNGSDAELLVQEGVKVELV